MNVQIGALLSDEGRWDSGQASGDTTNTLM